MEKYSEVKTELTEEEATKAGWQWNSYGAITGYTGTETELYIPRKIGDIDIARAYGSFSGDVSKVTKLVIPSQINYSGIMFWGFSNLQTVILEEGITKIGAYAFKDANKLEYLVLPSTVEYIEINALAFTGLKCVIIPKNVVTVGDKIFGWCTGGAITVYCEAESQPEGWDDNWLRDAPEGTTVVWGYKGN